jgi:hypothetical protein
VNNRGRRFGRLSRTVSSSSTSYTAAAWAMHERATAICAPICTTTAALLARELKLIPAWYFWNSKTGEVTWTNPLEPETSNAGEGSNQSDLNAESVAPTNPPLPNEPAPQAKPTSSSSFQPPLPPPTFGLPPAIPDIDPDLAYLLPMTQRGGAGGAGDGPGQSAAFNARTGKFAPVDTNYTYDHLDEYNRMKRMSSHYFDVEAWEKQRQEDNAKRMRDEAEGKGREKPTRKDMVSPVVSGSPVVVS